MIKLCYYIGIDQIGIDRLKLEKIMKIIKVKNPAEGARKAFDIYQSALSSGVKVLGLATGSTPIAYIKS